MSDTYLLGDGNEAFLIRSFNPSKSVTHLKRLYEDEQIVLDPTDGKRLITQATDIFTAYFDQKFEQWGLDVSAQPTGTTEFAVHEQIMDGTFVENLGSLNQPYVELCSTLHQTIEFVVKHHSRLRGDRYGNFFLLQRTDGELFVADVHVGSGGCLGVGGFPFSDSYVWRAKFQNRFVVPRFHWFRS